MTGRWGCRNPRGYESRQRDDRVARTETRRLSPHPPPDQCYKRFAVTDEDSSASTSTVADLQSAQSETSCPTTPRSPVNHKRSRGTCLVAATSSSKRLLSNPDAACGDEARSSAPPLCEAEEDACASVLDDILRRLAEQHLELTANDRLQLERSARSAMRTLLQWIETTFRNASPLETITLQLLAARMQLLWKSYHTDGLLDAVQMLTLLFLLVVRGSIFRDVPVEPWDSVDLAGNTDSSQTTASMRAMLLRHLTPLYSCVLPHVLMQCPTTLELCQRLIQDLCPCDNSAPAPSPAPIVRVPDGVKAIVLDLDDTVFLHQQVRQLREVYWVLAQAKDVPGVDQGLLRDVVMPAVPHRDFLLSLLDSMEALGRPVYVASFGLKEWVLPVAELVFGNRVPASNIFALDGHPPRFPVVLNKNLWLAEVMERHGLSPRDVLLVDDQISNVARALAGGFSALQVPPSRGLDSIIWTRALANATTDGYLLPPPPRTHAYCPAPGAVFADGDGSVYAQAAQDVVIQAPDTPLKDGAVKDNVSNEQPAAMAPATPQRPRVRRDVESEVPKTHHRFILRHGDFEAVRSMVTPSPTKPRHARSRSQDVAVCFDAAAVETAVAPSTPSGRVSRPPLRRVRSFSAAGWWGSVGAMEPTALCAQMARLGMTAEA